MIYGYLLPSILVISVIGYFLGTKRAKTIASTSGGIKSLHSLPAHYGLYNALSCLMPTLLVYIVYLFFEDTVVTGIMVESFPQELSTIPKNELSLIVNDIKNIALGNFASGANPTVQAAADQYLSLQASSRNIITIILFTGILCSLTLSYRSIKGTLRARNIIESIVKIFLICCSCVAVLTTLGIVLSVLFEAIRFFQVIPLQDFLLGLDWSPQTAIREDQAGSSGAFGVVPVITGTVLIACIAMMVAIPVGLLSAIYLSEFASEKLRTYAKPMMEILAGIPTVVYGFFAALTVAPLIRDTGSFFNIAVSSESALAAGLVMGIMIIPFVSSLSDDVIHAVPQSLRDGSLGLGATHFETIKNVVLPAALPGIVGSILLAVSRAIGETMIVVMAAGLSANLTYNPLKAVTTVTVQIVSLLVGDQEFDSPKTLAAFALGLLLFIFTLCLNIIALGVVRKYREQYD